MLTGQCKGPAQGRLHQRASRRQLDGALKGRCRFVELASLLLHQAEDPICWREMRVQLDGVIALLQSSFVFLLVVRTPLERRGYLRRGVIFATASSWNGRSCPWNSGKSDARDRVARAEARHLRVALALPGQAEACPTKQDEQRRKVEVTGQLCLRPLSDCISCDRSTGELCSPWQAECQAECLPHLAWQKFRLNGGAGGFACQNLKSQVRSQNENDVNGRPSRKDFRRCL